MRLRDRSWLAVVPPYVWLLLLFLFPFALVLKLSFSHVELSIPPYAPQFDPAHPGEVLKGFSGANYRRLTTDALYISAYLSSLKFAAIATVLLLLTGYPLAYGMSRCRDGARQALVMAVTLPFFTSFLIRIYAWIAILKPAGLLNAALGVLHIPPLSILNTDAAVYIGLVYAYLPFMVLPLYAVLEKQDEGLIEAAADLGATRFQSFWRITFPISLPGMGAGALLCFIPIVGEFVIPDLLGGSRTLMIGKTIWTEFFANRDWPSASAAAIVLLLTLVLPIVLYQRQQARTLGAGR
jgi:putrescine transport system permease protein